MPNFDLPLLPLSLYRVILICIKTNFTLFKATLQNYQIEVSHFFYCLGTRLLKFKELHPLRVKCYLWKSFSTLNPIKPLTIE